MAAGDDLDHDPAVLNALNRAIAGVDPELLADCLRDRDLTSISYPAH